MSIVQHKADRVFGLVKVQRAHRAGSSLLFAVPVLAFLLAGCGATRPVKYYQLTYPSPAPTAQSPLNVSLLVRSFDSLNIYKQDRIVYGWSANEIGTYESQRWVAPPTELLQSVLVRGLRFSGQFRSVLTVRGEGGGDYALTGYLYEFGEVDGAEIVARLNYVVRLRDRKTGDILWTHTYNHDEPATEKSVPAVVVAMDKNVQKSVTDVTASLADYFQAHPPKAAQN
jgi:ABC-type uncharacterized transport system auxiliary subunit